MSIDTGIRDIAEPRSNHRGKCSFTYPTQTKAGQGYAKLHGGKEFVEVLLNFADGTGADAALVDQLLDASIAHADHGKFRGNEKGVRCHQKNHQNDPKEDQGDHGLQSYNGRAYRQKAQKDKVGQRWVTAGVRQIGEARISG